jgi:hypothetical protein
MLGGYIPYGMRFFESHFPYGFFFKKRRVPLKTFMRRIQDYSRISWSTFQPRDASSTPEDFWLVVLRDT